MPSSSIQSPVSRFEMTAANSHEDSGIANVADGNAGNSTPSETASAETATVVSSSIAGKTPAEVHPQCLSPPSQSIDFDKAISYLSQMKSKLANEPQVYQSFLNSMNEYKSKILDETEVRERVMHLFRDHPDQIDGFNTLIPPTLRIRLTHEEAISYLNKVQRTFASQPQVYTDLLDIMDKFKSHSINISCLIVRVADLLKNHPQLFVGFNIFLPPGFKIEIQANNQVKVHTHDAQTSTLIGAIFQEDSGTPSADRDAGISTQSATDASTLASLNLLLQPTAQSSQIPSSAPATVPSSSMAENAVVIRRQPSPPLPQHLDFDETISYVIQVRLRFANDLQVYRSFLNVLQEYRGESLNDADFIERVMHLFKDHPDLIVGFNRFLPPGYRVNLAREDAISYLDQVKRTLANRPQVYDDLVNIMNEFESQRIDTSCFSVRVAHLLKDHPQLFVGFNMFLPHGYKIEAQANNQVNVYIPDSHSTPDPSAASTTSHTSGNRRSRASSSRRQRRSRSQIASQLSPY